MTTYRGIGTTDTLGDVTGATITEEVQTATAGQTVFTLAVASYTPGADNLAVYINGVRQSQVNYTETSSTVVTMSEGLEAGDEVAFVIGEIVSTSATVNVVTVAQLPAAASNLGAKAFVSDATASTFASIVAGGGGTNIPVYSDGTDWRIG